MSTNTTTRQIPDAEEAGPEERKLELEIASLKAQNASAAQQRRKLKLEVSALEWQNSWKGHIPQFSTFFTVLATVVTIAVTLYGVWQGYRKLLDDREAARTLEGKQLAERIYSQSRSDIQQLLKYNKDNDMTLPYVVFLFQDLSTLVNQNAEVQKVVPEKQGYEIAHLLALLVTSTEFDLAKPRNVEFDRISLQHWQYYKPLLRDQYPQDNRNILSSYLYAINSMRQEDPVFASQVDVEPSGHYYATKAGKFTKQPNKVIQFVDLYLGYKDHVDILIESMKEKPAEANAIKADLDTEFCAFYNTTRNAALTKRVFGNVFEIQDPPTQCKGR